MKQLSGIPRPSRPAAAAVAAAALLLGVVLVNVPQTAIPAVASGPVGATYVALGDSYAAGEGLGGFERGTDDQRLKPYYNTCHRSRMGSYGSVGPKSFLVLPQIRSARRGFWACSGARTYDMTMLRKDSNDPVDHLAKSEHAKPPGQRRTIEDGYQDGQRWQTDMVTKSTKWVSISAGGNDAGFAAIGNQCAAALITVSKVTISHYLMGSKAACQAAIADGAKVVGVDRTSPLGRHLSLLYRKILDNAPDAVLAVAGYPAVFPTSYALAGVGVDRKPVCVTNNLLLGRVRAGIYTSDARNIDHRIIRALNTTARSVIADLTENPAYEARYAKRIVFAETYAIAKPQSCTGITPGVTVNGVVLSPGYNGTDPRFLHKFISTATFHPTASGQKVQARAVQAAFASRQLKYGGASISLRGVAGLPVVGHATVAAGQPPLGATISSGVLPAWMHVTAEQRTLTLAGTPDTPGSWSFALSIRDRRDESVRIPVTVTIAPSPLAPVGTPSTLPPGAQLQRLWARPDGGWLMTYTSADYLSGYIVRSDVGTLVQHNVTKLPAYVDDLTFGPDSTAYFTTAGGSSEASGGQLLRLRMGADRAERLHEWLPDADGVTRNPGQVEYVDGKLYVEALSANVYFSCRVKLYELSTEGWLSKESTTSPTSCGGSYEGAAGRLTALDYESHAVRYFDPLTLEESAIPIPNGELSGYSVGSSGEYAFLLDSGCAAHIAKVGLGGTVWDTSLAEFLPHTSLSECSFSGLAISTSGYVIAAVTDGDQLHTFGIDPGGTPQELEVSRPGLYNAGASVVADGASHIVVVHNEVSECATAQSDHDHCSQVVLDTYRDSQLLTTTSFGGSFGYSEKTVGTPVISDGAVAIPIAQEPSWSCTSCGGGDTIYTTVLQHAADLRRASWHDPA